MLSYDNSAPQVKCKVMAQEAGHKNVLGPGKQEGGKKRTLTPISLRLASIGVIR